MPSSPRHLLMSGCLVLVALCLAACAPRRIPPLTVADLMEDRVTLDGLLIKCNDDRYARSRNEIECVNARVAAERIAKEKEDTDPQIEKKREEEFERRREQLRLAEERKREAEEAKDKVDPYSLPVIPVEPAATAPQGAPTTSSVPASAAAPASAVAPATTANRN
jgi:hypothetical protein